MNCNSALFFQPIESLKELVGVKTTSMPVKISEVEIEDYTSITHSDFSTFFKESKEEDLLDEETKAASYVFIKNLIIRYKDEPLPSFKNKLNFQILIFITTKLNLMHTMQLMYF